ncbi:hypothetical protein ABI59_22485 [Acidobacteria bacterium Mor1]|nr:hypothetical protein ABI59_22485 [Acidobacteria bacterium Mor1]
MNVEWLIVGGGIHGVHIAARLIGEAGVAPQDLRIVDPGDRLLARWRSSTATTGMTHLRSPAVHHLDLEPWSLKRFAGTRRRRRRPKSFAPPYDRPKLTLFNAHCERVVNAYGLSELHLQNRVTDCAIDDHRVGVRLSGGDRLEAANIVLAIGAIEQPAWPDWAPRDDARVSHVFEPGPHAPFEPESTVAVVGGGMTAAQVALRLSREGHPVHLLSRHPLRLHQFDSDPGWLGPRFMKAFLEEPDLDRRRELITDARHRGSIPPDVRRPLRQAIVEGKIVRHESDVRQLDLKQDGVALSLSDDHVVEARRVLLATGFDSRRPGGRWIDELIESESLPVAQCGYPVLDSALRWHPRVRVSGALAELELGPVARNIAGARRAGERIVGQLLEAVDTHPMRSAATSAP